MSVTTENDYQVVPAASGEVPTRRAPPESFKLDPFHFGIFPVVWRAYWSPDKENFSPDVQELPCLAEDDIVSVGDASQAKAAEDTDSDVSGGIMMHFIKREGGRYLRVAVLQGLLVFFIAITVLSLYSLVLTVETEH